MGLSRREVAVGGMALAIWPTLARAQQAYYAKAADYSELQGGTGLLVAVGDQVVFERYTEGTTGDTAKFVASAAKSFWGVAAAAMIEDGLIASFDEPAVETLTEWSSDSNKSSITLRQILNLTSGVKNDIPALQGDGSAENKYAHAVTLPLMNEPGSTFTYGPVNFYIFGEIARRKLKGRYADPLAYLDERIFRPIGLRYGRWTRDKSGNPHIPNGADISARDWLKFGRLALRRGRHDGRQLVRADLMEECFRPGPVNPGYGLTWWLNAPHGWASSSGRSRPLRDAPGGFIYRDGLPDLAGALGAGPNRLLVIPSRDMVVVRQSPAEMRPTDRTYEEHSKLNLARRSGYSDSTLLSLIEHGVTT